jgi:hypothetical protein
MAVDNRENHRMGSNINDEPSTSFIASSFAESVFFCAHGTPLIILIRDPPHDRSRALDFSGESSTSFPSRSNNFWNEMYIEGAAFY